MRLQGKRVGVLVEDNFEDLEFWVPVMRLQEEGADVRILGPERGKAYPGKKGLKAVSTDSFAEVSAKELDGLVVPGGWAPDRLRRHAKVLELVRAVDADKKPLGFICHAGWVAVSAKLTLGRCTGTRAIKDDLENAGGRFVDEPAFREANRVWGRVVEDIPAFCRELVAALAER